MQTNKKNSNFIIQIRKTSKKIFMMYNIVSIAQLYYNLLIF